MSLTDEDRLMVLQRFVDRFPEDLLAVQAAVVAPATPAEAKRLLVGGLNYALDMLDMYPDHYKGIGIADDAIVLRVAAKLARAAGAAHPAVEALGTDANLVGVMFEDLAGPLEQLVAKFPERDVRGRTADKILASKDTMVMFEADIVRESKRHKPHAIDVKSINELRKMMESALERAGVL